MGSFSPLPFTSLLFIAIFKASSDKHFAFLHFFFLRMVLIIASCTMSWTSVHSSSGTLSDLIPWIYLLLPLYNRKGFDFGHTWMVWGSNVEIGTIVYKVLCCAKSLQLCPTLCDAMDCSLPGSYIQGVLQASILEWVAMPSSRESSQPKDWTQSLNLPHWQVGSLPLMPPG